MIYQCLDIMIEILRTVQFKSDLFNIKVSVMINILIGFVSHADPSIRFSLCVSISYIGLSNELKAKYINLFKKKRGCLQIVRF
jgi:hypothetical protein